MTRQEIGQILAKLRTDAGYTREYVASCFDKSVKTIGHWETGHAMPDANLLFLLCTLYNADLNAAFGFPPGNTKKSPPLQDGDAELLENYHALDPTDRGRVLERIDMLLEADKYKEDAVKDA